MLQSYIFIRYLCKYKAEIISICQMSTGKLSCFLPRLVTKKYPAVNLPDIERSTSLGSEPFSCFLDNGLNNVITHSFLYLAVQPCFAIVG